MAPQQDDGDQRSDDRRREDSGRGPLDSRGVAECESSDKETDRVADSAENGHGEHVGRPDLVRQRPETEANSDACAAVDADDLPDQEPGEHADSDAVADRVAGCRQRDPRGGKGEGRDGEPGGDGVEAMFKVLARGMVLTGARPDWR